MIFHTKPINLCMCGACLEAVVEIEQRATHFGALRTKFILAPLGLSKRVWSSINRQRMFFVKTSTLFPSMCCKAIEHGRYCVQNNQLLTKSDVEFKDNSPLPQVPHTNKYLTLHVVPYKLQRAIPFPPRVTRKTIKFK